MRGSEKRKPTPYERKRGEKQSTRVSSIISKGLIYARVVAGKMVLSRFVCMHWDTRDPQG